MPTASLTSTALSTQLHENIQMPGPKLLASEGEGGKKFPDIPFFTKFQINVP